MNWRTNLPLLGDSLGKLAERIWPDKNRQSERALDIELEEIRQSNGRITPRMLLKYIIAGGIALYLLLSFVVFFFPELGPLPAWLQELLPLAGILFGFGN